MNDDQQDDVLPKIISGHDNPRVPALPRSSGVIRRYMTPVQAARFRSLVNPAASLDLVLGHGTEAVTLRAWHKIMNAIEQRLGEVDEGVEVGLIVAPDVMACFRDAMRYAIQAQMEGTEREEAIRVHNELGISHIETSRGFLEVGVSDALAEGVVMFMARQKAKTPYIYYEERAGPPDTGGGSELTGMIREREKATAGGPVRFDDVLEFLLHPQEREEPPPPKRFTLNDEQLDVFNVDLGE